MAGRPPSPFESGSQIGDRHRFETPMRRWWPPQPAFRFGRAGRICRRVPLREPVRPSVPALGKPASAGPLRLFARPRIFAPPARTVPQKGDRHQFESAGLRGAPVCSGSMRRVAARMRVCGPSGSRRDPSSRTPARCPATPMNIAWVGWVFRVLGYTWGSLSSI